MKNRKSKEAFTLIEIMLVIVIIGIIVGIAAPKIGGKLGKAQNVAARASLKAIETAIQSYEMDNLRLPDSLDDGEHVGEQFRKDPAGRQRSGDA